MDKKILFYGSAITAGIWAFIPALYIGMVLKDFMLLYWGYLAWVIVFISMVKFGAYYFPPDSPLPFMGATKKRRHQKWTGKTL